MEHIPKTIPAAASHLILASIDTTRPGGGGAGVGVGGSLKEKEIIGKKHINTDEIHFLVLIYLICAKYTTQKFNLQLLF